jgi:hypothetical protein
MTQPTRTASKAAVVMRFATLGGATVIVTLARQSDHSWQCLGCLDCNRGPIPAQPRNRRERRAQAAWERKQANGRDQS